MCCHHPIEEITAPVFFNLKGIVRDVLLVRMLMGKAKWSYSSEGGQAVPRGGD